MKAVTAILIFIVMAFVTGCPVFNGEHALNAAETIEPIAPSEGSSVLVELFTSEGCSSCPPADRVLATIARDQALSKTEVITLAFHVDYWNYLGWKDRFSSAAFTKRQEAYARHLRLDSTYTPQMVVDGSLEFVGSNRVKALDTIAKSSLQPKSLIDIKIAGNSLIASISELSEHSDATVYLAIAESNLTTKVGGGENSGSTLEHASVVRDLITIGHIFSAEKIFKVERSVPLNRDWKSENIKYVVFVQENSTLRVLAVKQIGRQ